MRFMLNGGFTFQNSQYWRIDDLRRMQHEHDNGTYDPIATLQRFDIAINKATCTYDEVQIVVDALNTMAEPC